MPHPPALLVGLRGPRVILREGLACAARLGGAALAAETVAPGTAAALGAVDFGLGVTQARADLLYLELHDGALLAFLGLVRTATSAGRRR